MVDSNAAAKKATIGRHRAALELWVLVHEELENAVIRNRILERPFARALDLLFIQAFKSHGSLYPLSVLGHCEDAATISRRIFEIALQVGYLDMEESERENRGRQYLAYFWHIAQGMMADPSLPPKQRQRWQEAYDNNKKWLKFNKHGKPLSNWSGFSFSDLANKLNMKQTYDVDYRFFSNVAHASSAGTMSKVASGVVQIIDDTFVTPILVYGTRYMLAVTEIWNTHFKLIEDTKMGECQKRALNFDLKAAADALRKSHI